MIHQITGERIDITEIMAGLEKLQQPDKTPVDVIGNHLLVAQLMDITPSSSFEEAEWAEGGTWEQEYVCNNDFKLCSRRASSALLGDSDDSLDLKFPIEEIKKPPAAGLLRQAIEQREKDPIPEKKSANRPALNISNSPTVSAKSMYAASKHSSSIGFAVPGWTVESVISSIVDKCIEDKLDGFLGKGHSAFDLRIIEEEGVPDMDLPQLDLKADILNVGESSFVLCAAGESVVHLKVKVKNLRSKGLEVYCSFLNVSKEPFVILVAEKGNDDAGLAGMASSLASNRSSIGSKCSDTSNPLCMSRLNTESAGLVIVKNNDTGDEFLVEQLDQFVPRAIDPSELFGGILLQY